MTESNEIYKCDCGATSTRKNYLTNQHHLQTLQHRSIVKQNISTEEKKEKSISNYKKYVGKMTDEERKKFERERKAAQRKKKKDEKIKKTEELKAKCDEKDIELVNHVIELTKLARESTDESKPIIEKELATLIKKAVVEIKADTTCKNLKEDIKEVEIKRSEVSGKPIPQDKTIKTNLDRVKNLYKKMFEKEFDCKDFSFLKDFETVDRFITENWPNQNTQKSYHGSIAAVLRTFEGYENEQKQYSDKAALLNSLYVDKKSENLGTEKELKAAIRWDNVMLLKSKAKKGSAWAEVIFELFTAIPPRRAQDYARLKVFKITKDTPFPPNKSIDKSFMKGDNFIVLNKRGKPVKMIIDAFKQKARNRLGMYKYTFKKKDKELVEVIKNYIDNDKFKVRHGHYIFDADNEELSEEELTALDSVFSKEVKDAFIEIRGLDKNTKNAFGINDLRKSFSSWHFNPSLSTKEKHHLAKQMGTSLATIQDSYLIKDLMQPQYK